MYYLIINIQIYITLSCNIYKIYEQANELGEPDELDLNESNSRASIELNRASRVCVTS
jgi:hypothetical protein